MRRYVTTSLIAVSLAGLALGGCARRGEAPPAALNSGVGSADDDDAFCRSNGGPAGSNEYVNCRKNRDARRGNSADRADKAHRRLGDDMLRSNPVRD